MRSAIVWAAIIASVMPLPPKPMEKYSRGRSGRQRMKAMPSLVSPSVPAQAYGSS
jgi:hypothetical protein